MFHRHGHEGVEWHHLFHHGVRGLLPIAVLSLIKDKPTHGGEIFQGLKEKFDIDAPRPMIYVLLRRLEGMGLMVSKWDIQESGPARRKYTITEEGIDFFKSGVERLKEASKVINILTGEKT